MAILNHVSTRIYGLITGQPPFQNQAGQASVSSFKSYPTAPLTSIPTTGVTFWPLANGLQTNGGYYVYSIIELPPTGLNVQGVKLATDLSVTALIAAAT